jgi:hypothetical protein
LSGLPAGGWKVGTHGGRDPGGPTTFGSFSVRMFVERWNHHTAIARSSSPAERIWAARDSGDSGAGWRGRSASTRSMVMRVGRSSAGSVR